MSLARKHKQKMRAIAAGAVAAETGKPMVGADTYELMLAKLGRDKKQLGKIDSLVARSKKKAELLPDYQEYVDGMLISNAAVQDDCLVTVMLWHIDCHQFDKALDIAEYAMSHDLSMPGDFSRNLVTTVTEQIAEEAIKNSDLDMLESLQRLALATDEKDMLDEVRAKLYRALGERLEESDTTQALEYLKQACELNDKVGVKTKIKTLEKKLETPG